MAREVAKKNKKQVSIPPVLLEGRDKQSTLKYINNALSHRYNEAKTG